MLLLHIARPASCCSPLFFLFLLLHLLAMTVCGAFMLCKILNLMASIVHNGRTVDEIFISKNGQ